MTGSILPQVTVKNQEAKKKVCSKCGESFPATLEFFHANKMGKYGVASQCKKCRLSIKKNVVDWKDYNPNNNILKDCSICGRALPGDNKHFSIKSAARDGLNSMCKECEFSRNKKYYNKNKDVISIKQKIYCAKNNVKISRDKKEYYLKNRIAISEQKKKAYSDNPKIRARALTRAKKYASDHSGQIADYQKEYYLANKKEIIKRTCEQKSKQAEYSTYKKKLAKFEKIRMAQSDRDKIEVRCVYCGKWFIPTNREVNHRLGAINSISMGGSHFYDSKGCKDSCPSYRKIKWPEGFMAASSRESNPHLRQIVFNRDNYECQRCGRSDIALHCHHVVAATQNPMTANDPDVCITLCKKCHKEVHTQDGCRYHELKCHESKDTPEVHSI